MSWCWAGRRWCGGGMGLRRSSNEFTGLWTIEKCLSISLKSKGRPPCPPLSPAAAPQRKSPVAGGRAGWMKGELEEEQWLICASDAQSDRGPGSAHILFWPPGLSPMTSTPSAYGRRGPEGPDTGTLSQECDAVADGGEVVRIESWPKTSNNFFVHWEQNNSGINGPNWNATQGPYWSCGLYFGI